MLLGRDQLGPDGIWAWQRSERLHQETRSPRSVWGHIRCRKCTWTALVRFWVCSGDLGAEGRSQLDPPFLNTLQCGAPTATRSESKIRLITQNRCTGCLRSSFMSLFKLVF
jgi:hypothetical protein